MNHRVPPLHFGSSHRVPPLQFVKFENHGIPCFCDEHFFMKFEFRDSPRPNLRGCGGEPSFHHSPRPNILRGCGGNAARPPLSGSRDRHLVTLRDPTFCADAGGNAARPPLSGSRDRNLVTLRDSTFCADAREMPRGLHFLAREIVI